MRKEFYFISESIRYSSYFIILYINKIIWLIKWKNQIWFDQVKWILGKLKINFNWNVRMNWIVDYLNYKKVLISLLYYYLQNFC